MFLERARVGYSGATRALGTGGVSTESSVITTSPTSPSNASPVASSAPSKPGNPKLIPARLAVSAGMGGGFAAFFLGFGFFFFILGGGFGGSGTSN